MDNVDGGTVGNILLGISTLGLGLGWARDKLIKNRIDTANSEATVAVADAQQSVYTMLTGRLETLEKEVQGLRSELQTERLHSRKLEIHIWKLEKIMSGAGLELPVFGE